MDQQLILGNMKKLIIFLFLFISLLSQATTYYVAPSTASPAGSDSNSGTISSPWLSLNHALSYVSAGDIIYMRGGTYRYNTTGTVISGKNGSAGNYINIWAYPGEVPIINYDNETFTSQLIGIYIQNANYLYLKGIRVTSINQQHNGYDAAYGLILWSYVSNCIFEQMETDHIGGWGTKIGDWCNNNVFLNCDSHHNSDRYTNGYGGNPSWGWSDGFQSNSYDNPTTGMTSDNNSFIGCRSYWNSDDGWDLRRCAGLWTFDHCWSFMNGRQPGEKLGDADVDSPGGDGEAYKFGSSFGPGTTDIKRILVNSLSYNNNCGIEMVGGENAGASMEGVVGGHIYNNIFYHDKVGANIQPTGGYIGNISLYNNVFLGVGGIYGFEVFPAYEYQSIPHKGNNIFNVNGFYHQGTPDLSSTCSTSDFTSIDPASLTAARQSDGSLPVLSFLKIASTGKPEYHTGVNVSLTTDGVGNTWNNPPSLGAYEYNTGGTVTNATLTTTSISNITTTTATGGGNVTSDGGATVTARGVCWNTSINPTISNSHSTDGSGTGTFTSSIYGLTASTTYYVRAYATNSVSTSYGSVASFTTSSSGNTILTISGQTYTNAVTGQWDGVNISRSVPTTFSFLNNSITSVNSGGYMLQAGDESVGNTNNNLDGEVITGNQFIWNGTDVATTITHGIFVGYNINAYIRYNYLKQVPTGMVIKSDGMTYTSGGVAYNIINKNGDIGIAVKGMNNVPIYNNTFYSNEVFYTSDGNPGTEYGLVDIFANDGLTPWVYPTGTIVKNNIFYTVHQIYNIKIEDAPDTVGFRSDYNIFWCEAGTPMFSYLGVNKTFAQWQALGYDLHSVVVNPSFNNTTDLVPTSRLNYGTNLGTTWQTGLSTTATWAVEVSPTTTDQNGTWQVGASVYASTAGNTYYISNAGNDSNTGLDQSNTWAHHPWMSTWTGTTTLAAGDVVYMKRGDTWSISSPSAAYMTVAQSGTSGRPIITTAYGSGAKPIIKIASGVTYSVIQGLGKSFVSFDNLDIQNSSSTRAINDYANGFYIGKDASNNVPHDWVITSCDIHNCPRTGIEGIDDSYNITIGNLNASSTATTSVYSNQIYSCGYGGVIISGRNSVTSRSDFNVYYNYIHEIDNTNTDEDAYGITFSSNDQTSTGQGYSSGWPAYCTAKYNYVATIPGHEGIDCHGGSYIYYLNNYVKNCHSGLIMQAANRTYALTTILDHGYIQNNIVENTGNCPTSGFSYNFIDAVGESSVYRLTNVWIQNNTCFYTSRPSSEIGASGIAIYNADGVTIDGNKVYNGPLGSAYGGIMFSSSGLSKNITIKNNWIDSWAPALYFPNSYMDGDLAVYNNIVRSSGVPLYAQDGTIVSGNHITIYNNSLFTLANLATVHIVDFAGSILNSGASIIIKNNILGVTSTDTWGYYVLTPTTISGTFTCNNNLYWNETKTSAFSYLDSPVTFAAWQGYGYDANSFNSTDPLFTNGSTTYSLATDFTLQATSPCINAGVDVGLTTDYVGNSIVGLPDIGALEYYLNGITLPVVTTATPVNQYANHVVLGGTMVSNGGDANIVAGICFNTSPDPDINLPPGNVVPMYYPGVQTNPFANYWVGPWSTTYYYRAYGTNSAGTSYGAQYSFTTTAPSSLLKSTNLLKSSGGQLLFIIPQ
jgi:hypothetical protein